MIDTKKTLEAMLKAGWTASLFMDSVNSTIRMETALRPKNAVEPMTAEQADAFFKSGRLDGDLADTVEAWVLRRQGTSNTLGGNAFSKPVVVETLNMINPPVILPVDMELSQDGPDITFRDTTNQRARKKMLADGLKGSA